MRSLDQLTPEEADRVANVARALAHPLRVRILQHLTRKAAGASSLAKALNEPLGDVSYHLNVVLDRKYDVVRRVRTRKTLGHNETVYEVNRKALLLLLDPCTALEAATVASR